MKRELLELRVSYEADGTRVVHASILYTDEVEGIAAVKTIYQPLEGLTNALETLEGLILKRVSTPERPVDRRNITRGASGAR